MNVCARLLEIILSVQNALKTAPRGQQLMGSVRKAEGDSDANARKGEIGPIVLVQGTAPKLNPEKVNVSNILEGGGVYATKVKATQDAGQGVEKRPNAPLRVEVEPVA